MTFLVRDAVLPQDQPALIRFMAGLCDLEHALHPGRQTGADGAEAHFHYLVGEISKHRGRMFIAESGNGDAAAMLICAVEDFGGHYLYPRNRVVGYIHDLWIEPAYRGSELLDLLLTKAEEHFHTIGISVMMISHIVGNDVAAAAYKKRGFQPNEIMMERPIAPTDS